MNPLDTIPDAAAVEAIIRAELRLEAERAQAADALRRAPDAAIYATSCARCIWWFPVLDRHRALIGVCNHIRGPGGSGARAVAFYDGCRRHHLLTGDPDDPFYSTAEERFGHEKTERITGLTIPKK